MLLAATFTPIHIHTASMHTSSFVSLLSYERRWCINFISSRLIAAVHRSAEKINAPRRNEIGGGKKREKEKRVHVVEHAPTSFERSFSLVCASSLSAGARFTIKRRGSGRGEQPRGGLRRLNTSVAKETERKLDRKDRGAGGVKTLLTFARGQRRK